MSQGKPYGFPEITAAAGNSEGAFQVQFLNSEV
jgi:hypothetical protein